MRNARLDRLAAEVAAMKRHAPTSRLRLYELGDGDWSGPMYGGGPIECINLPREAPSVEAWLASCNEWITNH